MATFASEGARFLLELVRDGRVVRESRKTGVQRQTLATELDARAMFDRRVVQLVDEGWGLVAADDDFGHPVASDPDQEREILAATDDRGERLAVYADWLIERGDPCGELASLRARNERDGDPALAGLIQRIELAHDRALFGLFNRVDVPRGVVRPIWLHGWIDALDIASSSGTLLALLLLAPMARFVRGLVFRRTASRRIRAALARAPRRDQIRNLVLASAERNAQDVLDHLPGLTRVAMSTFASVTRGHPAVRHVELEAYSNWPLGGAWPSVETVVVTLAPSYNAPRAPVVLPVAALPALHTVELRGAQTACDAFAAELPPAVHLIRT